MLQLLSSLLTLLFFLSGPAMKGNAEIWHSTLAAKTPVLGETALKGVGDDMLVHFSQTGNRASIAANGVTTEGASYFYRVGDVRNLTAAQVRGAIGPLARGGVDNSLAVIVSPEAASFTRVQMVLPEYVTMQN